MSAFAGRPIRTIQFTPKGRARNQAAFLTQRVVYGDVPGRNRREKRANLKAGSAVRIYRSQTGPQS